MNTKKDKYLELPGKEQNDDPNEDFSLNPKEFLLETNDRKRKTKYIFCFSSIICFFFGYLICYLFKVKDSPKNENIQFTPKNINFNPTHKIYDERLLSEIQNVFNEKNKVNINEVEYKLNLSEKISNDKVKSTVHIAFTLDPGFTLETMLTISSILASQNIGTKIVFHFGVIDDFKAEYMLKMYELKDRINNLTEFNFYLLKEAMEKMQNFHTKGAACPGKFELPQLVSDDVERVLLFDAGDVLVLRDLTELFNYPMGDKWVLGPPEPRCIGFVQKYNKSSYINIGSILLNVNELKKNNFWNTYTKNRHLECPGAPDQTLFNILVPDDKIGYFPFRFGGIVPMGDDKNSDKLKFVNYGYETWFKNLGKNYPDNPKTNIKLVAQMYNSVFVHQFNQKWEKGSGLTIYRHLAKYFMILGGIWEELCNKKPGYCV
jgi:hypothetical protein